MFEIGNSLREARLRQGLDLSRAEADTKIRSKYLQALEAERFDVLPAETYVKGFLRAYAEYLGLDGQLYVDEFNSRFASAEEPIVASAPPRRPRGRASESSFVVVALAGIVAVTILVVVAFGFSNDRPSDPAVAPEGTSETTGTTAKTGTQRGPGTAGKRTPAKPATARLVLTAARGDCWVEVRRGSATGDYVFGGTIEEGQTMRFVGRRLWLDVGAAENLDVTLNGRRIRNFPTAESVVLVTAKGVRTIS